MIRHRNFAIGTATEFDLISGGRNGKIFWMKGISFPTRVLKFKQLLAKHNDSLGESLLQDSELCEGIWVPDSSASGSSKWTHSINPREKLFDARTPGQGVPPVFHATAL